MKKRLRYILVSLTLVCGCKSFKEGYNKGFQESFKASFKKNFVESCMNKDPERAAICECGADKVLAKYTTDQLTAPNDEILTHLKTVLMPECVAELSFPVSIPTFIAKEMQDNQAQPMPTATPLPR